MKLHRRCALGAALLAVGVGSVVNAQAIKNEPEARIFTAEEIAAVDMPDLAFEYSSVDPKQFDKYFYYHREDTSFDEAFDDISECDSLVSGYNINYRSNSAATQSAIDNAVYQYGAAGLVGGMIGSMLADAIFGSAERRKQKRINMRNCMYFKGYDRFGLEKDLWKAFHFEEGLSRENADDREAALLQQALVASGPRPATEVLVP